MYYHKFDFGCYINQTKFLFEYYEVQIKSQKINRPDLLAELDIPASTFSKSKKIEQRAGSFIIGKLHKYFNTKMISLEDSKYYEKMLSSIISSVYYRKIDGLDVLSEELEQLLKLDNIFKPVFVLFDMLISITLGHKVYRELKEINNEKFHYVKNYYEFYSDELKVIYAMLEFFLSEKDEESFHTKYFELFNENNYILGLHNSLASTKFIMERDYSKALVYLNEAMNIFEEENNFNRLILTANNLCSVYNSLEKYLLSYKKIKQYILSAYYVTEPIFDLFKVHYYQVLLILNLHDEMNSFYNHDHRKTKNDYFYMSLLYYRLNNYEKFTEIFDKLSELVSLEDKDFRIVKFLKENFQKRINVPSEYYSFYWSPTIVKILKEL